MAKFTDYLKNIFFLLIVLQIAPPLLKSIKKQYFDFLEPQTKVGYLVIKGAIYDSTYYVKHLRKFFKNSDIKAVLLRIESPGSAAGTAESIANELELLKKDFPKPTVTLCENICTSGAYYIAACTDYIIAAPSGLIGSIGTQIPYQFKLKAFLEQFKIQYQTIKAGDYKTVTDPFSDVTPEQSAYLQALAQDSYQNFIEHVARRRSRISLIDVKEWADGKIFTGRQALRIGLIDELGSRATAIKKIKELGIIEDKIEWIEPPARTGIWGLFDNAREKQDITSLQSSFYQVLKTILGTLSFLY